MRILRIRRGFTTNSSGANEYLPDGGVKVYDGGTPSDGGAFRLDGGANVAPRSSAPAAVLSTIEPWGSTAPASEPVSNSTAVGVVFLAVAGAFVAGPVIRMILRRRRKASASPPPDDHAK